MDANILLFYVFDKVFQVVARVLLLYTVERCSGWLLGCCCSTKLQKYSGWLLGCPEGLIIVTSESGSVQKAAIQNRFKS